MFKIKYHYKTKGSQEINGLFHNNKKRLFMSLKWWKKDKFHYKTLSKPHSRIYQSSFEHLIYINVEGNLCWFMSHHDTV